MTDTVDINFGPFTARLLTVGATLNRFRIGTRDLVLGFRDPADHANHPIYAGAIVGPIANRIGNGRVVIGNQTFQMRQNENDQTTLHSGDEGLHAVNWTISAQSQSHVEFNCTLQAGHAGLPGLRNVSVIYQLNAQGMTVEIKASSDCPTPMNIAHHPYWALEPDQSKTQMQIAATHFLPVDRINLPTGAIDPVAQTKFDFVKPRAIGRDNSIDHNYCLANLRRTSPRLAARLQTSDGLIMTINTTEPGLQVYTGSGLPSIPQSLCFGSEIHPNAGIALEPQGWPDAPNNEKFPNIIIGLNDVYHQVTQYHFSETNLP